MYIEIYLLASEQSERDTLSRSSMDNAIHTYIYRYTRLQIICGAGNECHIYIIWVELGHSQFLCVPAVSNVVSNGNSMGTSV